MEVLATAVLTGLLAAIAWIDARSLRIPDALSLPLIALGLGLEALRPDPNLWAHAIGAAAGYGILALIGGLYYRHRGNEALGLGDAKLFAAAGAWLGWRALPQVLLIAAVSGLLFARARKTPERAAVAFGPWLALGFWLVWLLQEFGKQDNLLIFIMEFTPVRQS